MANLKGKGEFFEDKDTVSDICKWCCIHAGKMLKVEANTTSCVYVYQPKVPKDLQKYRRKQ